MVYKYVSVKAVIAKLFRDLQIKDNSRWVDMIEWCGEALDAIGATNQYGVETKTLTVSNAKAELPCNFHKIIQISYNGIPLKYSGTTLASKYHTYDADITAFTGIDYTIND